MRIVGMHSIISGARQGGRYRQTLCSSAGIAVSAHIGVLAVQGALQALSGVLAHHALVLKLLGQLHHDCLPDGRVRAWEAEAEADRQLPVPLVPAHASRVS